MRKSDLKKPAVQEGLGDLAQRAEMDHEVQMARAELYKVAKYAIKLHDMLKGVSEQEGLEGWVQSKITKSADYISSVYHHLDYENAVDVDTTETAIGESYKDILADRLTQKTASKTEVKETFSPKEIAQTSGQMKKLLSLQEQHRKSYNEYKHLAKRIALLTDKHNGGGK